MCQLSLQKKLTCSGLLKNVIASPARLQGIFFEQGIYKVYSFQFTRSAMLVLELQANAKNAHVLATTPPRHYLGAWNSPFAHGNTYIRYQFFLDTSMP